MGISSGNITPILSILPEILLLILALVVLGLDLGLKKFSPALLGWVTVVGLIFSAIGGVMISGHQSGGLYIWGGMLRQDAAASVFQIIFITGAALTAFFALEDSKCVSAEFYFLLLISTLGMCLLAASSDLIMIYLSLELASIPLYILAGFHYRETSSVEAGLKYMLYGAVASTIMVFGFTFLYGFSGTTQLYAINAAIQTGQIPPMVTTMAVMLILAGVGYKISAVPFHFWAPDVYAGAPTVVAGFISTASKAAGFAVLLRLALTILPVLSPYSPYLLAAMAVASMLVGNLLAINQKNFKRLLAYSSIAQAGYILVGVAASNNLGATGVTYYLMAYLVTNLTAFALAQVIGQANSNDDISSLAGLTQRSPVLAFALLVSLLSLGGIPPFAGFVGKLLVFSAGVQAGMAWLVIVAVLNSVLSLYYYLKVLKIAFLDHPRETPLIKIETNSWRIAFIVCLAGILILGVIILPWYGWSITAASSLALY